MELRLELCPPTVDPGRLREVGEEIDRIAALVERDGPVEQALAALNAAIGTTFGRYGLPMWLENAGSEEIARDILRPPVRVSDITRDELIELVHRIQMADDDTNFYIAALE